MFIRTISLVRITVYVPLVLVFSFPALVLGDEPTIRVAIIGDPTQKAELAAGKELAKFLRKIYPHTLFEFRDKLHRQQDTHVIVLGTRASQDAILNRKQRATLATPGSFVVFTGHVKDVPAGYIVGADAEGLWNGIYGLLKSLDFGFYLSFDSLPQHRPDIFSFDGWNLENRPLVPVRIVFNWHNFLSGCSTWNLEQWEKWIIQSQKMGFNAIMVHAYGNNPMAGFAMDDRWKKVGYITSTRIGRDWSTNHVTDVQRMHGGRVFDDPVFGCVASIEGSDAQRTNAAQNLMSQVFDIAEAREMKTYFALDMDTYSANPQDIIKSLPENDRFMTEIPANPWLGQPGGPFWVANPDTPKGYVYYRSQVEYLLKVYPQIDVLVIWHRIPGGKSPLMRLRKEDIPKTWQAEYSAKIKNNPRIAQMDSAVGMYAMSKITRAMQRALKELGRDQDVQIASGTWGTKHLALKDLFFPCDVAFLPLDCMVLKGKSVFKTKKLGKDIAQVAKRRQIIPIVWAHHDDGSYVGRPFMPATDFMTKLEEMSCEDSGFGIIHWTTRPLDSYFASLANQTWEQTQNESYEVTCRRMAKHMVGQEQAALFSDYLYEWATTAPKFGRETSDFFIDHPLMDLKVCLDDSERRLAILNAVDMSRLKPSGRNWVSFFRQLEQTIVGVHKAEYFFHRSKEAYSSKDLTTARQEMDQANPEKVIEDYAACIVTGGITKGEQGVLITMNTRWLSHYIRFRQMYGMEPIRYNFGPTFHEQLAQSAGIHTFHFDKDAQIWEVLGKRETGSPVYNSLTLAAIRKGDVPATIEEEVGMSGLVSTNPIRLEIRPIMKLDSRRRFYKEAAPLAPGRYRLDLLFGPGYYSKAGPSEIDIRVSVVKEPLNSGKQDSLSTHTSSNNVLLQTRHVNLSKISEEVLPVVTESFTIDLLVPSAVSLELIPAKGKAWISGAVLTPVAPSYNNALQKVTFPTKSGQ